MTTLVALVAGLDEPWDDFARMLDRSPASQLHRNTTPLLLLQSEGDLRCPAGQTELAFMMMRRLGQTVELSAKAKNFISVREALEITPDPPGYLYRNKDDAQGVLSRLPDREEIPLPAKVEERLIVEFYSKN